MKMTYAFALLAFTALSQPPAFAQDDAVASLVAEPSAIWQSAAVKIEQATTFATIASLSYDVTQPSGRKLQFSAEYELKAKRPDRFYAGVTSDDGRKHELYYDGAEITLVNVDEKLFATFPHQGSIESAIDVVLDELNAAMPLSVLLRSNLQAVLSDTFEYSAYVGKYAIGDARSEHLLLSNDAIDLQLWINNSDELDKLVITYRNEDAAPQYAASFKDWRFGKKIKNNAFEFEPDEGFDKIEFLEAQQ